MADKPQQFGTKSESLAAWYLKKNGYKIIEQNYRTPLGEIDIIAKEKRTIVFVFVKSRRSISLWESKMGRDPSKATQNFHGRPAIFKVDPADG